MRRNPTRLAARAVLPLTGAGKRVSMRLHHAPFTLIISSPDGVTVHSSCRTTPSWCRAPGPAPARRCARRRSRRLALIDRAAHRLLRIGEIDVAVQRRRRRTFGREPRKAQLRALADHAEPHVDHLDRLVRRMVRIAVLVERVERLADLRAVAGLQLIERHRHRQRELLARRSAGRAGSARSASRSWRRLPCACSFISS